MTELNKNNGHYSEQNGHALRGQHERIRKLLGGVMPESIPGFDGINTTKSQLIRRTMRRTPRTGKK